MRALARRIMTTGDKSSAVRLLFAGGIRWTVRVVEHPPSDREPFGHRTYVWFTHGTIARVATVNTSALAILSLDDPGLSALLETAIPALAG